MNLESSPLRASEFPYKFSRKARTSTGTSTGQVLDKYWTSTGQVLDKRSTSATQGQTQLWHQVVPCKRLQSITLPASKPTGQYKADRVHFQIAISVPVAITDPPLSSLAPSLVQNTVSLTFSTLLFQTLPLCALLPFVGLLVLQCNLCR